MGEDGEASLLFNVEAPRLLNVRFVATKINKENYVNIPRSRGKKSFSVPLLIVTLLLEKKSFKKRTKLYSKHNRLKIIRMFKIILNKFSDIFLLCFDLD